ncbi:Alpha-N-arabinofuranosidase 1 protein [Halorhabdus tiamatea SARL4B]|uniref:non-reducing end alpha-L-arabinofuranosidase n=1 Tax=Halorhabdus tiamatea SARL4B TaxID=1033806 RepID=F7PHL7_9EURY|nr:alpha-L-arabinofuranosidase C-terminal domain-containing protein [Halorhabdus tiamatea]ERJ05600.1 Alpha-N-arabinofuranosidase 1 protein [Halorhabdus tiamatea SARL4B]CCQ35007.1 alpha-L-arabinofuranosidase, family GH51 [Halorhabdus tiamatea SARL4B]
MTRLLTHTESDIARRATVRLDPETTVDRTVDAELFGKFGEHLYSPRNVSNILEAQTLFNPTLGSWKFQDRRFGADGGRGGIHDPAEIDDRIGTYAETHDLPEADRFRAAYRDGTALFWFPYGDGVTTSPDVGTAEDRAQRIEVRSRDDPAGIAQWCHFPLHRTRTFEGKTTLRATDETDVRIAIHSPVADDGTLGDPVAATTVTAGTEFETVPFALDVPASAPDDALLGVSVTTVGEANIVLDRLLVYPDDHVETADPELVELLDGLPVLRWPGGNFASGYDWKDGVGPVEDRPTRPNPAWDAIETNLFGTDEFLQFCDAIDAEPVICVNAGDGTLEEAAQWVEYCNGSADTEMGALRAEHGHPEPYDVTYWEIGNEIYGEWQITWSTPGGYADRFDRFRAAMTAVDDSIELMATGNRLTDWNDPTVETLAGDEWLTDHVLIEAHADATTDPVELFNAHTGLASQLGEEYRDVAVDCRDARVDPRLAITELQLFTRFDEAADADAAASTEGEPIATGDTDTLSAATLPNSHSITEAVFDATVRTQCIRDGDVRMVTHSGIGNHGGGIRHRKARTWADPCLYGRKLEMGLIGGTPIGVELTAGTFSTETAFGTDTSRWFGELRPVEDEPVVDAVAVVDADDHDVALVLTHRDAGTGPIEVTIDGESLFADAESVAVETLTAASMHAENTLEEPTRISPTHEDVPVEDTAVTLSLSPYSVVRVTVD